MPKKNGNRNIRTLKGGIKAVAVSLWLPESVDLAYQAEADSQDRSKHRLMVRTLTENKP